MMKRVLVALILLTAIVVSSTVQTSSIEAQRTESVWTLSQTLVNPRNDPTEVTGPPVEGRKQGSRFGWTVGETSITHYKHEVDNGFDYYDVSWTANFDRPPTVLTPGETIELNAKVTGGGRVTAKDGSGIAFEYRAEGVRENHLDGETYITIGMEPFTTQSVTGSFLVPPARPGAQIKIFAFLWNCSACSVHFIYEAEEVPRAATIGELIDDLLLGPNRSIPVQEGRAGADVTRTRIQNGVGQTISALGGQIAESAGPDARANAMTVGDDFKDGADQTEGEVTTDDVSSRIIDRTKQLGRSTIVDETSKGTVWDTLTNLLWECDSATETCKPKRAAGHEVVAITLSNGANVNLGVIVSASGRILYTTDGENFYTNVDEAVAPSSRGWGVRASELISSIKRDWSPSLRGRVNDPEAALQIEVAEEVFDDFRDQMSAGEGVKSIDKWAEGELWDKAVKGPLEEQARQLLWSQGRDALVAAGNSEALSIFDDLKAQFDDGKTTTPKAWTQIKQETGVDLFELSGAGNAAVKSVEFAVETVKDLARTGQRTDFSNRAGAYFEARNNGLEPITIWQNEREFQSEITAPGAGVLVSSGTDSAMSAYGIPQEVRQGILFTMYEEAYQRWLLAQEIGRSLR